MPPRTLRSLAVVVAALVLLCGGRSLRAGQRVSEPYQGVTYIDRTETAPRAVHMHVLQIDLTAGGIRYSNHTRGTTS